LLLTACLSRLSRNLVRNMERQMPTRKAHSQGTTLSGGRGGGGREGRGREGV
jgi:hypothetical protein